MERTRPGSAMALPAVDSTASGAIPRPRSANMAGFQGRPDTLFQECPAFNGRQVGLSCLSLSCCTVRRKAATLLKE